MRRHAAPECASVGTVLGTSPSRTRASSPARRLCSRASAVDGRAHGGAHDRCPPTAAVERPARRRQEPRDFSKSRANPETRSSGRAIARWWTPEIARLRHRRHAQDTPLRAPSPTRPWTDGGAPWAA